MNKITLNNPDLEKCKNRFKCTIVGISETGKSCLAYRLANNAYNTRFNDKPLQFYKISLNGEKQNDAENSENQKEIVVIDVSGSKNVDRIRSMTLQDSDIIIIVYSIDNEESYEIIKNLHGSYRLTAGGNPLLLLVAHKIDLRQSKEDRSRFISTEAGKSLAEEIKANAFIECSALSGDGIYELLTKIKTLSGFFKDENRKEDEKKTFSCFCC